MLVLISAVYDWSLSRLGEAHIAQLRSDCGLVHWDETDPAQEPIARLVQCFERATQVLVVSMETTVPRQMQRRDFSPELLADGDERGPIIMGIALLAAVGRVKSPRGDVLRASHAVCGKPATACHARSDGSRTSRDPVGFSKVFSAGSVPHRRRCRAGRSSWAF
jgi:hypothetical protein